LGLVGFLLVFSEPEQAPTQTQKHEVGHLGDDDFLTTIRETADVRPTEALALLDRLSSPQQAAQWRQAILTRWAILDPLDVLAWLGQHPEAGGLGRVGVELPSQFYARIGSEAGQLDDREALSLLVQIDCGHGYLHDHLQAVEKFAAARLQINSPPLENLGELGPAFRAPLEAAAGDLIGAIKTINSTELPPSERLAVVQAMARCWAQSDHCVGSAIKPGIALEKLSALVGKDDSAWPKVFPHLHRVRTETGLSEWLLAQKSSPARDSCLLRLAQSQAVLRPELARLWVRAITTPSVREAGMAESPELF
jgi:hypothetical protein